MITMWKCKFVRANTNGHKATCVWSVWCSWQAWHQTFHWISSENEVMKSSIEGAFIAKAPSCAFRILGSLWMSWNQSLAKLPDLLAPCFLPALDDSSKFGCLISNLTNVVSFIFYIVLYSRLFCLSCLHCLHSLARRIVASKQCQSTDLWSRTLGPCGMGLTMASQTATEHKSDMPTEWHCASGRKKHTYRWSLTCCENECTSSNYMQLPECGNFSLENSHWCLWISPAVYCPVQSVTPHWGTANCMGSRSSTKSL